MTDSKSLKFAHGPQTTLAIAQKASELAATIRYDDGKGIVEGDEIDVLDANTCEKKGTATVKHDETVPVHSALDVVNEWWANYGIKTRGTLVSELNRYYDDTIRQDTEVKVLILDPNLGNLEWGVERE